MAVTVKNKTKTPLVVPPSVRRPAGHKNGPGLEFRVSGGVIAILPKPLAADDKYTSEQTEVGQASVPVHAVEPLESSIPPVCATGVEIKSTPDGAST
jgi:hypothetical protein